MKKTAKQPKGTRVPKVKKKTAKVASYAKDKARLMDLLVGLQKQVDALSERVYCLGFHTGLDGTK
jgi:hypothetical protein